MKLLERLRQLRREAKERGEPVLRDLSFDLLLRTAGEKQPESILKINPIAIQVTSIKAIFLNHKEYSIFNKKYAIIVNVHNLSI